MYEIMYKVMFFRHSVLRNVRIIAQKAKTKLRTKEAAECYTECFK